MRRNRIIAAVVILVLLNLGVVSHGFSMLPEKTKAATVPSFVFGDSNGITRLPGYDSRKAKTYDGIEPYKEFWYQNTKIDADLTDKNELLQSIPFFISSPHCILRKSVVTDAEQNGRDMVCQRPLRETLFVRIILFIKSKCKKAAP